MGTRAAYSWTWVTTVRPAVLERDGYRCQVRGARCTVVATTVDHIDPVVLHGTEVPPLDRLRAACRSCNSSLGARLTGAARRYEGPSRSW